MSSILLSNPFPAPPPTSTLPQDTTPVAPITPVAAGADARGAQDAGGNTNPDARGGTGDQKSTVALFQSIGAGKWTAPPDATGGSVVNAQAQGADAFGTNLPAVEMPDPLPTSPFLKGASPREG